MSIIGSVKSNVAKLWKNTYVKKIAVITAVVVTMVALAPEAEAAIDSKSVELTVLAAAKSAPLTANDSVAPLTTNDTEQTGQRRIIRARYAVYNHKLDDTVQMGCSYTVNAAFGVSIFTNTKITARRLVRLDKDTKVHGSCAAKEGGKTIGCAGMTLENQWIRVKHGTIMGWAPKSCLTASKT